MPNRVAVTTRSAVLPLLLALVSCRPAPPPPASAAASSPVAATPVREPLFAGLGGRGRKVTTASADAQRYFDQGLSLLCAFNHDEAIRSFRQATELDPSCAMAFWGIAYANGPHINNPVVDEAHARAAWAALTRARELAPGASEVERALIEALGRRYADAPTDDRKPLDEAYALAMREVWKAHPGDADVGALLAEALMDLRPWDLWTEDGQPQPGTDEILSILEGVHALDGKHPLAHHLYIHAMEASPHPEKADAAADVLRDQQPGLGHLVHMPSHVDVRRGRWEQAAAANDKAMEADRRYRELRPSQGFYRVYMAHNHHMLAFAAMMRGESARALAAIDQMVAGIPEDWLREHAAVADGFLAMPLEVRMRFGRWDEVLAAPEPAEYLPIARSLRHYARGVAHAAKGQVAEAEAEQKAFLEARSRVPEKAFFGNNAATDLLAVAEHVLRGEILYRAGKVEAALGELAEGVRREDRLRYDEPPDWILPVRHALGAALLQAGRSAEAERVYREDLARLPGNGWSLYGLARCLRLQGKDGEAADAEARFARAWERGDVKIVSSCLCLPGA